MTSLRPYLIRAIYEWILDNCLTPYLLVNADKEGAIVPENFIQDGRIILNLRPEAIQNLSFGNSKIEFNARFGGKPMQVEFPVSAVAAIYARENGKGMIFDEDEGESPPSGSESSKDKPSKPVLKVVK